MDQTKNNFKLPRGPLLALGLVLALTFTYIAFEWRIFDPNAENDQPITELPMDTWYFPALIVKKEEPKGIATKPEDGSNLKEEEEVSTQPEEIDEEGLDSLVIIEDEEPEEELKVPKPAPPRPKLYAEEMPYFPTCENPDPYAQLQCTSDKLDKFLEKNLSLSRYRKLKPGMIMVDFVVNEMGFVAEVFVKSQHALHPSIENEIISVFKKQPRYVSARQNKTPVAVWMQKPLHVKIQ